MRVKVDVCGLCLAHGVSTTRIDPDPRGAHYLVLAVDYNHRETELELLREVAQAARKLSHNGKGECWCDRDTGHSFTDYHSSECKRLCSTFDALDQSKE